MVGERADISVSTIRESKINFYIYPTSAKFNLNC